MEDKTEQMWELEANDINVPKSIYDSLSELKKERKLSLCFAILSY